LKSVKIKTTARLAFCLIDLNGERGRVDGCIGLSLNEPSIEIFAQLQNDKHGLELTSLSSEVNLKMVEQTFNNLLKYYPNIKGVKIEILESFGEHHGLGCGTQMRLSIAAALNYINNSQNDNIVLAKQVERGGTSGIGVWTFKLGGLIIDGGHSFGHGCEKESFTPSSISPSPPPPLIGRYDFPSDWKILCITPISTKKLFGESEINLFKNSCPVNREEVDITCWTILMRLLPALTNKNLSEYNLAIEEIQDLGFKKNVWDAQSSEVKVIKNLMKSEKIKGIGLSSLGSTLFATIPKNDDEYLIRRLTDSITKNNLRANIWSTTGRNIGAEIKCQ
jgi:beta-ribofuranosylaminobenzene 5'-phosphate synthase